MSFSFQISGHVPGDQDADRILYDLAVRMVRKAREIGATGLKLGGGFAAGPINDETGIDEPEVPFVGCQACETDGWPTPMDPRGPCPSCGATYDPEGGVMTISGEDVATVDATVRVPPAERTAVAHPPRPTAASEGATSEGEPA
jgi:hypothetical protein